MQRTPARLIVGAMTSALILAACGSGSPTGSGASATTTRPPTTTATSAAPTTTDAPTTTAPTSPPATSPPATVGPIDLSGTPGVTAAEQARAEKLIRDTISGLQWYSTPARAYAAGYRSIGDASTGDEHYVNWSYVNDGRLLDPAHPESVVFEYRNGVQQAVAAMYMLPFGSTFSDVPDVGGSLTQWHVHANLCLTDNPEQRVLSGITSVDGQCPAGSTKAGNTPMLHVWVVPNDCGPFAALEGVGAGQVPPGQTRQCSTKYASVP